MILETAYTLRHLPIFNQLAIIAINFVTFALLVTVFNHNRYKDGQSRIFLLMVVSMLLWVDFAYLARIFGLYPNISVFFLKIAWIATPPLFYFTYLLSVHLIGVQERYKSLSIFLFALTLVLSVVTGASSLIIKGVHFTGNILDIDYGLGFYPFLFAVFLIMIVTLLPLIRSKPDKDKRAFLVGVIIFYVANSIFNISLPLFLKITHLYFFGDYSTVFLLLFTVYAIIRHNLFEVRVIAAELIIALILAVLFSNLFIPDTPYSSVVDLGVFIVVLVLGVFLVRSVISEVQHREEIESLNKKLRHMDQVKNEFISVAAHELRAPLTAIKGYLSMVIDGDAGPTTEQQKDFLQDAVMSNERIIRLVNNLLNVSRIEEKRIVFTMKEENLREIIEASYKEFRFEAVRQNLDFQLIVPPDIYDRVNVDKDRLHEVIVNFVSNAIKYTEQGSVKLVMKNPTPDIVRVEVVDTGPGISDAEQKKLFHKFYRVKSKTGSKTIGSGLGLYISKLLIKQFDGNIGVNSEEGKGSNFWFELPVVANSV